MIISASRRTDIPAFYSEWFFQRLQAGCVEVHNPFNPKQAKIISLCREDVDAIVFWTRNPAPLLARLPELDALCPRHVWLMTITGAPRALEPAVPKTAQAVKLLRSLSKAVGPERVVWRFDPVFITNLTPADEHLRRFTRLARQLAGVTKRVIISFADIYGKVPKNVTRANRTSPLIRFSDLHESPQELRELAASLAKIAGHYGFTLQSCAESLDLSPQGIMPGQCIDAAWLNSLFKLKLTAGKDPGQRKECRCVRSVDIGVYDTCLHGCVYCYATRHSEALRERSRQHDPALPYLK